MSSLRKKLIAQHEFVLLPSHMEHPVGVSCTVPDESYSIKDLLEKFSRGMDPGVSKQGIYDSGANFDSPDLEKLKSEDLFDREEFATALSHSNAAISKELEVKAAKDKVDADNAAAADFEAKVERLEKSKAGKASKKEERSDDAKTL